MPHNVVLTVPGSLRNRTYRRDLPASWSEVPEARRLPLLQHLMQTPGLVGQIHALRLALNLPDRLFFQLPESYLVQLLEVCSSWMAITPDPKPRIESFVHKGTTYYLPNAHGINMVALEFPIADEYFMQFVHGQEDGLIGLCATICREGEKDLVKARTRGDQRVPLLSRPEAEARAKDLVGLSPDVAMAVLLYFAGVKEFIHNTYGKTLFEQKEADADAPAAQGVNLSWWGIYFDTAVEGPWRDIDVLYQAPFHDVCVYVTNRIQQRKDWEAQQRLASDNFGKQDPT
jgi:hypothetical protein